MTNAYKPLYQGQPGTSAATVYTVPGSTTAIIRHIRVANLDTDPQTIKLFQGGTADDNVILPELTIPGGGWAEGDVQVNVEAGETIAAQASAAALLTLTLYGLEIS